MHTSKRSQFLVGTVGAALAASVVESAPATASEIRSHEVSHALVLSGGGAQGAYEAGVIAGLAARAGVVDGQPLAPYGMVSGTSIGALNAWFVATGQYAALRTIWHTIAAARIFRLKSKYETLDHPHSFIGVRVRAALRLAVGLSTSDSGIVQTQPILDWMSVHVDPKTPLLVPFAWSVTNLTTQTSETFYRLAAALEGPMSRRMEAALRLGLGEDAVIREASDDMLHGTLLASAATPLLLDPVVMPMADGAPGLYVDGGVASDSSISVARTGAHAVHIVFVESRRRRTEYKNVIDLVLGSYETMKHKILETELRGVYFESLAILANRRLPEAIRSRLTDGSPELTTVYRDLPPVTLAYIRPEERLPATFSSFDDQESVDASYAAGERDGERGFTPYAWKSFRP